MEKKREKRRWRAITAKSNTVDITDNDCEMFYHLATMRYLTPQHLANLTGKNSKQYTTLRLKQLSAHNLQYVKPYNYDELPLHWPDVYMLDKAGEKCLLEEGTEPDEILRHFRHTHDLSHGIFKHDFPGCHVAASIIAGAKKDQYPIITWQKILANATVPTIKIPCKIKYTRPDGSHYVDNDAFMVPDEILGIKAHRHFYFTIEIEKSNPKSPENLNRSSTLRKVLSLDNIHEQAEWTDAEKKLPDYERPLRGYRKLFNISNMRTIFIYRSEQRMENAIKVCEEAVGKNNYCLFGWMNYKKPHTWPDFYNYEYRLTHNRTTKLIQN